MAISSTGPVRSAGSSTVTLSAREWFLFSFTSSDPLNQFLFFCPVDGLGDIWNLWDSGLKCIFYVFVIILIKRTTARLIWKQVSHFVSLTLWTSVFAEKIWSSFVYLLQSTLLISTFLEDTIPNSKNSVLIIQASQSQPLISGLSVAYQTLLAHWLTSR